MVCILIIFSAFNNFCQEMKNHASVFVKVFLIIHLWVSLLFLINIIIISETYTGFLAQYRRDNSFPDRIMWTDEATFTPNGVFNSRNFLIWMDENPHAVREQAFQYRWAINVWAGVIGNQIVSKNLLSLSRNVSLKTSINYFFRQFSDWTLFSTTPIKWTDIP